MAGCLAGRVFKTRRNYKADDDNLHIHSHFWGYVESPCLNPVCVFEFTRQMSKIQALGMGVAEQCLCRCCFFPAAKLHVLPVGAASCVLLPLFLGDLCCFGRGSRSQLVFLPPSACKARLLGAPRRLALSPLKEVGISAAGQPEGLLPLAFLLPSIVLGALPLLLPELEAPAQLLLMLLLAFSQLSG